MGRDTSSLATDEAIGASIAQAFETRHNRMKNRHRTVLETNMSDAFQDRENTFEKQFAHDEDLRFKAVARRNKALALWVADMKALPAAEAEKYADDFVGAQVGHSDDDVAAALKADLAQSDIDLSDHRLRKKMDEEMAEAAASVKAGK
jgi:hypothetical protein